MMTVSAWLLFLGLSFNNPIGIPERHKHRPEPPQCSHVRPVPCPYDPTQMCMTQCDPLPPPPRRQPSK